MIGEEAVVRVVDNTVDRVTLKEARIFTGNEVGNRVGIILRYVVSVVRVKRDKSVAVDLGVGRLGYDYPVVVAVECAGSVAGLSFSVERN